MSHIKNNQGSTNQINESVLGDTLVAQAKNQTSKGWYVTAVVVGAFFIAFLAGFGGMGLLQVLPKCLAAPQWSHWTALITGLGIGGSLITYGAFKIHTLRKSHDKSDGLDMVDSNSPKMNVESLGDQYEIEENEQFKISEQPPIPDKLYQTQNYKDLGSAKAGDYSFVSHSQQTYMIIKGDKGILPPIIVRQSSQSTQECKKYRWIITEGKESMPFTAPQLATMYRLIIACQDPNFEYKIFGFTKGGLIVFTRKDDRNTCCIVDEKGVLQEFKIK